jgi:Fe-S-cluster-containing hydrogenase component 2
VDRCPAKAATYEEDIPQIDRDRCFGCGVCAMGCPADAIQMIEKPGTPEPPLNRKGLREAMGSRS